MEIILLSPCLSLPSLHPLFHPLTSHYTIVFEGLLAVPQLIRNHQSKDTTGISLLLIISWFVGDAGKLIYYYYYTAPIQLYYAAGLQITTDLGVLLQMVVLYPTAELHHYLLTHHMMKPRHHYYRQLPFSSSSNSSGTTTTYASFFKRKNSALISADDDDD